MDTEIDDFNNGIAIVKRNDLYTLINSSGEELTEPKYQQINPFYNGYALVKKDNKYGFINASGTEVIEAKYDDLFTRVTNAANTD